MISTLGVLPASAGYAPSPGRAIAPRLLPPRSRSPIIAPPLVGSEPTRTGTSGPRLHLIHHSTHPPTVQPLHQPQEYSLPGVPRQQPVDDPSACSHDLAGDLDHRHAERAELHPQQRTLLG